MYNKPLHHQPYPLPEGISTEGLEQLPFENVYHSPGEAAGICFFDPHSEQDLEAMREILSGKGARKWMDDTHKISRSEYREWAGTESDTSFLFAVIDARTPQTDQKDIRGFVYLYSEREEKFRVKRMEKQGFVHPATGRRYALEVSFAVRPNRVGEQVGSGLMSSGLRQSCLQTKMLLDSPDSPEVILFAFIDPLNVNAQRTVEASGFEKKGLMKYDWDSEDLTLLYILNWDTLQQKVRQKLLSSLPVQQ